MPARVEYLTVTVFMSVPLRSTLTEAEPMSSGTAMPGSANCTIDLEGAMKPMTPAAASLASWRLWSTLILLLFPDGRTAAASALMAALSLTLTGAPVPSRVACTR